MNNNSNSANPIKEFEDVFDTCVGLLANSNCQQSSESDELKLSVEQCVQKFLDKARELETFFVQKRCQISSQLPDQCVMEDMNDIKFEIARKDQMIERFNEKINNWQNILSDNPLPPVQQQQQMLIGQQNLMMNNVQAANLQQQMATGQQSMGMRQRSPIQQPMMQSAANNMRPQMMSPHPYQPQTYTPQIMQPNQQANAVQAPPTGSMMPDSPMNHQMNQMHSMQSAAYSPAGGQQTVPSSHLAFLEKTTSSIGLGPEARR